MGSPPTSNFVGTVPPKSPPMRRDKPFYIPRVKSHPDSGVAREARRGLSAPGGTSIGGGIWEDEEEKTEETTEKDQVSSRQLYIDLQAYVKGNL